MSKENIVIVGGGGAGIPVASQLAAKVDTLKYDIVVVSPRDLYFHMPALIRMVVTDEGKLEDRSLIPLNEIFSDGKVKVKIGKVTGVIPGDASGTGGSITLEDGENITFRYLVLAPGSIWEGPLEFPGSKGEMVDWVGEWRKKFERAKSFAIIGGGAVGLEFAGEFKDFYPNKKVTIIHAGRLPLNDAYPDKFRKDVLKRWKARGVEFVLDDRVDTFAVDSSGLLKTAKGKSIEADLAIPSRGGRPNTDFLRSLGNGVLDDEGRVKIRPTLQLESHPNIFAAGDILSYKEQKQVAKTPGHATVVATNVISMLAGKEPTKAYTGAVEGLFVTNGRAAGAGFIGALWGIMVGNRIVGMAKSKDLFVSMTRKSFGLAA